ncbi:MAG TPA: lytic transglycosylase domain-containing protein, partial [Sphingomicrobium sp.]|nr:lytic transglycosylase domain-containing protein [Sphingomicrobium sp.]
MSSMWRIALSLPVLLLTAPSSSAQYAAARRVSPALAPQAPNVAASLSEWRTLRQSSGYRFGDYARFLISNPGWPDDAKMRRWAEKAMQPGEYGPTVLAFYATAKPASGNGWARLADAYAASARMNEALAAAREAWASPDLSAMDEQAVWARYGASLTRTDHDRRVDALLFAKKADDAARFVPMATPQRQAAFGARVAMLRESPDAESRYQGVSGQVTSDPGLMMDRARYLRARNYSQAARDLAAREHRFAYPVADPDRFYDMLLTLANEAAQGRQWTTTYNITRHLRDALPPGTDISTQPLGVRDSYTSLAWLGGSVALDRLNRPDAAVALFDAYSHGGRSLQVQTKGDYWAGRAALAAGHTQEANTYFQRAAAYPDLFYGQLALERLGRS